jgi:hypothetical protein
MKLKFIAAPVILFIVLSLIYVGATQVLIGDFSTTHYAHYNGLLDAFLNGRLDIGYSGYEMSENNGKYYLNWGPAAVLYILPFRIFLGPNPSDIIYTLVAAMLNVVLTLTIIRQLVASYSLNVSILRQLAIVAAFALGSPNFFLGIAGKIWPTCQIISLFYLLCGFLLILKSEKNLSLTLYTLGVLALNLSWLTRVSSLVFLILALIPLYYFHRADKKIFWRAIIIGASVTLASIVFVGWYNTARFGSPFELGYHFLINKDVYEIDKTGLFNAKYILENLNSYFFRHFFIYLAPFSTTFTSLGNSIPSSYPFILTALFFQPQKKSTGNWLIFWIVISCFAELSGLMLSLSSGWTQWGSRYALNITALIFILAVFWINRIPRLILWLFVIYGTAINIFGIYSFYRPSV